MNGVIYFTLITFILSIILVILDYLLNKRSTKLEMVLKMLPGYNCGACGYGSCMGMASELLSNENVIKKCRVCKNANEIKKYLK